MIIHAPKVISAWHRRERAVQRQNFQSVPGQIQLPDNLRPQQRNHVRTFRKKEARENLLGYRCPAQHVTAFQNDDFFPCFGKVCRVN